MLRQAGFWDALGERFASAEGVEDALNRTPAMLFQVDEMDHLLRSMAGGRDPRYESIAAALLTLYSSANSSLPMRRRAGQEGGEVIDQPHLVLFGTAIPRHFFESLNERMLTNGLFARMLILESGKRGAGQDAGLIDNLPPGVLETAQWWRDFQPGALRTTPRVIPYAPAAQEVLTEARLEAEQEYASAEVADNPAACAVWSRANEIARKLALIHAVSENRETEVIRKNPALWGAWFARYSIERMLAMASTHSANSDFERNCQTALTRIRRAANGIRHSTLLRSMKMSCRDFAAIIETLAERGDVTIHDIPTSGRTARLYHPTV